MVVSSLNELFSRAIPLYELGTSVVPLPLYSILIIDTLHASGSSPSLKFEVWSFGGGRGGLGPLPLCLGLPPGFLHKRCGLSFSFLSCCGAPRWSILSLGRSWLGFDSREHLCYFGPLGNIELVTVFFTKSSLEASNPGTLLFERPELLLGGSKLSGVSPYPSSRVQPLQQALFCRHSLCHCFDFFYYNPWLVWTGAKAILFEKIYEDTLLLLRIGSC
jgi:hypothetical protein